MMDPEEIRVLLETLVLTPPSPDPEVLQEQLAPLVLQVLLVTLVLTLQLPVQEVQQVLLEQLVTLVLAELVTSLVMDSL
jgi:hypothetical protein